VKLPNAERAIVDDRKVKDYLLSLEHPIGRFKARVFATAGYHVDNWRQLQRDLLAAALEVEVEVRGSSEFGSRFMGRTTLIGPSGLLPIVTVWVITSEGRPRFVTAYPRALR
jgi:hypothetical protein